MAIMKHAEKKAGTIVEALPYIQAFYGKTIVIKYGGNAMINEDLKQKVMEDVSLMKYVGMQPVIVHGGGPDITQFLKKVGKKSNFVSGLRVTDEETVEIAEMVLDGKVNSNIVNLLNKRGVRAVGLSGKDAGLIKATKKMATVYDEEGNKEKVDIGYVGQVDSIDASILRDLLDMDYIPVIAPIGVSEEYEDYNINADDAACAVATALKAEKLVFLTDIEGVFIDPTDKSTLISEMDIHEAKDIIEKGVVGGGMLPKLNNCITAMENGVSRVHILDGRLKHCLLLEFFTQKGIGTAILKEPLF